MAAQYYLYCTTLYNTVICRGSSSFAPLPPNTGELYYDILIPETQPLYLYRESGSTIIPNTQQYVDEYIEETLLPPTPNDNVTYGEFTGTTSVLSAATTNLGADKVNVSGDTMTGSLHTTSNLTAVGALTGSSVYSSVWIYSPIISGTTCVKSPIVIGGTCLCSMGTTRLNGAATAASTLNVSGATRLAGALTALSTLNVSGNTTLSATARSVTPATTDNSTCIATTAFMRNYLATLSGGSTNYYYRENNTTSTTTSTTPQKYLGFTGTTMPTGIYQVDFTEQVGQASSNATVYGRFQVNGTTQGSDFLLKMNQAGFTFTNTLSRDINLTASTNCFDMYFWAGGGTACATFASVRIRKV